MKYIKNDLFSRCGFDKVYYIGDLALLKRPAVSIVGSRRPTFYAKSMTKKIASCYAKRGFAVVSGAAMGIDAMAHEGAGYENTIAVLPCSLDRVYPKSNAALIEKIGRSGLLLSPFSPTFEATKWSFVVRNRLVVALGDFLIVPEAESGGGSMRSAELALEMSKEILVLPHRLGESSGTFELLRKGLAKEIIDLEKICPTEKSDPFIEYLKSSPFYDEALERYPQQIVEAELDQKIEVIDGKIFYKG